MSDPSKDLSLHDIAAMSLATSLAEQHEKAGGSVRDLFAAFAGLVSHRDASVAADCLVAVERFLEIRAESDRAQ